MTTTLIPMLEHELRSAAARTTPPADTRGAVARGTAPRIRSSHRRTFSVAAALTASLTVAGGAYAARGLWMPELGADSYGHAIATADPVPTSDSSVLGVLRREQTDADRGHAVRTVLRGAGADIGKVRTNAVRRLGTLPDGRVAVLVPARVPRGFDPTLPNMGQDQLLLALYDPATDDMDGFRISDALGMRAGDLMFPASQRLTPSQRVRADAFLNREVAAGRLHRTAEPPYYNVMSVQQSDRYRVAVGISDRDPVTYIGVVPDGVARVRVDRDTTVPVHDNFFAAPSTVASLQPTVWLDAHRKVVPFASTIGAWK